MGRGSSKLQESSSKPLGGGGGGGNGKEPITVQPFAPSNLDLKGALGKSRKQPIGIKKALEGANPFYDQSKGGAQGDFSDNCQRAVIAYELRRRGYDVIALPTHAGDTLPANGKWRGAFLHSKEVKVGASSPKKTQTNLEKEMKSYGHGARGIVRIPGHVFNVENVNGKIRYVDAQTNTIYSSKNVFSRVGKKSSSITLIRTDNLRISDRAKKSVTPTTDTVKMIIKRRKKA